MFCQVCGLKNSDDEEFCARCHSKLLVLSGVGVVEETGEPQEEIPLDEHLLERISTLEDVVKRTAEAVKSLFESLGNLEKNLFVAHTGILALQETLERRGAVRSEEVVDLWESKMDERMQAVEKKDRFLERRDRIIARFSGGDREGFLKRLREAEFAILALDADRGIRVLEELFRIDRGNVELGFYLAETFFSAGELERASELLPEDPGGRPEPLRVSRLQRDRGLRGRGHGHRRDLAEARDREEARRVPAALRPRHAVRPPRSGGRTPRRRSAGPSTPRRSPSAHILLGNVLREKGELNRAIAAVRGGAASGARVRGRGLSARSLLPREELVQAGPRVLPAGAREEPAPARVPGGGPAARAPAGLRASGGGRAGRRGVPRRRGERRARIAPAGAGALPQGDARRAPATRRSASRSPCSRASMGRWSEAIAACREVLAADPEDVVAAAACSTARRGAARGGQRRARRPSSCASSSRSTRRRRPRPSGTTSWRRAWRNRAKTSTLALDYAGRALSAAPEELKPYPLAALGWVHYKRQEFDRAIECLRRSSERAAAPTTFHHLGMAYLAAGRAEEAKAAFTKAKTAARGAGIEDRMMQQLRSNLRLVEKVGPRKKTPSAARHRRRRLAGQVPDSAIFGPPCAGPATFSRPSARCRATRRRCPTSS